MHTGTQLYAFEGFETLRKDVTYHLLRSDSARERVLLLEFQASEKKVKDAKEGLDGLSVPNREPRLRKAAYQRPAFKFKPVLHYLSRHSFEKALDDGDLAPCAKQEELPPWLNSYTINDLRVYSKNSTDNKRSHAERIDNSLRHIWPLVRNLDQILAADLPDVLLNAHARACNPQQNETRLRISFYAYVCFGMSRWALHFAIGSIGRWRREEFPKKFGRPSRLKGANHGFSSSNPEMIAKIIAGYRAHAGSGEHLNRIYRDTMKSEFGCVSQSEPCGRKKFVHPAGLPFPTFGQFAYRVMQAFPLEVRQTHKYGHSRVRDDLLHSKGRYFESAGNLMERTEQDAYCCEQVAVGYVPGSHLPPLWVVRIRCIASGLIAGIGFSFKSETAAAYRMAQFCAAIDKVKFCRLFGIEIHQDDWPSIGLSPHVINDRGPGSTNKADLAAECLGPVIKEMAPSYSGQSKASIETSHPKKVKRKGKPQYLETRLTIPQIAVQEIYRTIADNQCLDVSDRLNNLALIDHVFASPVSLWRYLDSKGRNVAIPTVFDEAVRACLTPIRVTVHDSAVYYLDSRYESDELSESGILQEAHNDGRFELAGYMLDVCVRHVWVDTGDKLIQVDAMLGVRDGYEQLYRSNLEMEQIAQIRKDAKLELKTHREAARAQYEAEFEEFTGMPFGQGVLKAGRPKRSKAASRTEAKQMGEYFSGKGGKR